MNKKLQSYTVDEYGIKNYNSLYLLIAAAFVLYIIIAILSFPLVYFEHAANGNIKTYADAFWTLQMAASTIGFGDFYPITLEGRFIVAAMFYIGVGMVGFIGAQFVNKFVGFSDTNVKNREIRKQNQEIIKQNEVLEEKLELLMKKIDEK